MVSQFQGVFLQTSTIIGADVSSNVQFWSHLEDEAKLTSRMLEVLNKA